MSNNPISRILGEAIPQQPREQKWSPHANLVTDYWTDLKPTDEILFTNWVKENNIPFNIKEERPDYDMRGFWKAQQEGDRRASSGIDPYDKKLHFSDYFKTPTHSTFSNESRGATQNAPRWVENGRFLVDSQGNIIKDNTRGR